MNENKGISAIIGVILMIAITVVIAVTTFVYVNSLVEVQDSPPSLEIVNSYFEDQNLNAVVKVKNMKEDFHLVLALFYKTTDGWYGKLGWQGLYNIHPEGDFSIQLIELNCSSFDRNYTNYEARVYLVPSNECACSYETVSIYKKEFAVVRW